MRASCCVLVSVTIPNGVSVAPPTVGLPVPGPPTTVSFPSRIPAAMARVSLAVKPVELAARLNSVALASPSALRTGAVRYAPLGLKYWGDCAEAAPVQAARTAAAKWTVLMDPSIFDDMVLEIAAIKENQ